MNKFALYLKRNLIAILILVALLTSMAIFGLDSGKDGSIVKINAVKGSHIILKLDVMSFDKPAKLKWKGKGVKIKFHDIHGNVIDEIPPHTSMRIHAHIDIFDNGSFEIWTENGAIVNYSY